jgi:hypothetical protein
VNLKDLVAGLLGLTEYMERRSVIQKFRLQASELSDFILTFRGERSPIKKDIILPEIIKAADTFSRTCREVSVVVGNDDKIMSYAQNIFDCVQDIIANRSVVRDLKETLADDFEQGTEGFDKFVPQAKEMMAEADLIVNRPRIGRDEFGERLENAVQSLLESTKPATALFYRPAERIKWQRK